MLAEVCVREKEIASHNKVSQCNYNYCCTTWQKDGKGEAEEKKKRERESVRKERVAGQCGNDRFLCELSQPGLKRTQCVSQ